MTSPLFGLRSFHAIVMSCTLVLGVLPVTTTAQFGDPRWEKHYPSFNEFNCIVVDSSSYIYIGTKRTGILRSSDGGASWTVNNIGLDERSLTALAVHPSGEVLAGTVAGAFRSTDHGMSWNRLNTGPIPTVATIACSKTGRIYIGVEGAELLSSEDGTIWKRDTLGNRFTSLLSVQFMDRDSGGSGENVYVGMLGHPSLVLRSTDDGSAWRNLVTTSSEMRFLVVGPTRDIVAGYQEGIYYSNNEGNAWQPSGIPYLTWEAAGIYAIPRAPAIVNGEGCYLIGSVQGVSRSADHGQTFYPYSFDVTNVVGLAIDKSGHLFALNKRGIYTSLDHGKSWDLLHTSDMFDYQSSINSAAATAIAGYDGYGGVYYVTTRGSGLFQTSISAGNDPRSAWSWVYNDPELDTLDCVALVGRNIVVVGGPQGAYRSADSGYSWTPVPSLFSEPVKALVADRFGMLAAATSQRIYRSIDSGASWNTLDNFPDVGSIAWLCADSAGGIYAGTERGIYYSTMMLDEWRDITISAPFTNPTCFAMIKDSLWIVGTGDGMYRSDDWGMTWSSIVGMEHVYVRSLATNHSGHVVACLDSGVFASITGGESWKDVTSTLPTREAAVVFIAEPSAIVSVWVDGAGLYKSHRFTSGVHEATTEGSRRSILISRPNPVRHSSVASITAYGERWGKAKLEIVSSLGEIVAVLEPAQNGDGATMFQWTTLSIPAGIYFCWLVVDGSSVASTMIVVQ